MNDISKRQMAALLLIMDMFELFCCVGSVSLRTLWGILVGIALQFFAALIFVSKGGELKKGAGIFFLAYAVFCGGTVFSSLWRTSGAVYIPYESGHGVWGRLMTAGLIALVCLYCSSTGIKTAARAAVIAVSVGAVRLGIDFLSAVLNADWSNVLLPEKNSAVHEFVRGMAYSGSLGSFVILLGNVKGDKAKAVVWYFTVKAVISVVLILTVLSVAGGIMKIADFPVITAAQLSQPFAAQRIDSLFLVIFSVFAVFSAALQVMTGAYLVKELFPHFKRWRSSFVIVLTISSALLISGRELLLIRACAAAAVLIAAISGAKKSAA